MLLSKCLRRPDPHHAESSVNPSAGLIQNYHYISIISIFLLGKMLFGSLDFMLETLNLSALWIRDVKCNKKQWRYLVK